MLLLYIFAYIGIYYIVADIWRAFEVKVYKHVTPSDEDTISALLLSYVIFALISW